MQKPNEGPQVRRLKRGDLIFSEGDSSAAMYLVKVGKIRLFMSRSGSQIEIAEIRSGEILGELAFLDGNPRSVSAEALSDCQLIEISAPVFKDVLDKVPDWMKILLKTVVGRLRAVNTRIRQLEGGYVKGKAAGPYQYLTLAEAVKILVSFNMVLERNPKKTEMGIEVDLEKASFYSNHILGVPDSKTNSVIDLLAAVGAMKAREEQGVLKAYLQEIDFLEDLIRYLNGELVKNPGGPGISVRGFLILEMIMADWSHRPASSTDLSQVFSLDVGALRLREPSGSEKNIFKNEDVADLVDLGYLISVEEKSSNEVIVTFEGKSFRTKFCHLKFVMSLKILNEQKRKLAGISK